MNTGKFHPESNAYPGVFITGQDALSIAGGLKLIAEGKRDRVDEMMRYGADDPLKRIIALLESCRVPNEL